MSNYIQPHTGKPPAIAGVGGIPVVHGDALGTSIAPVNFVEPGLTEKDDPHRTWRGPAKTKLGF